MRHLCIDLVVFGRNKQAGKRVHHKVVDRIQSVEKVYRTTLPVHVAVMQHHRLEHSAVEEPELLATLSQPVDEHGTHLHVVSDVRAYIKICLVDLNNSVGHALRVDVAQDTRYREAAEELLLIAPDSSCP
jgi:hypothetical protein